jgi:hypothetical protein
VLVVACLAMALAAVHRVAFSVLSVPIQAEFGLSLPEMGMLQSALLGGYVLGQVSRHWGAAPNVSATPGCQLMENNSSTGIAHAPHLQAPCKPGSIAWPACQRRMPRTNASIHPCPCRSHPASLQTASGARTWPHPACSSGPLSACSSGAHKCGKLPRKRSLPLLMCLEP